MALTQQILVLHPYLWLNHALYVLQAFFFFLLLTQLFRCNNVCTIQTLAKFCNMTSLPMSVSISFECFILHFFEHREEWGKKKEIEGIKGIEHKRREIIRCQKKGHNAVQLFIDKHTQLMDQKGQSQEDWHILWSLHVFTRVENKVSLGSWTCLDTKTVWPVQIQKQLSTSTGLVVLPRVNVYSSHFPRQCLCLHIYAEFWSLPFPFFLRHHTHCLHCRIKYWNEEVNIWEMCLWSFQRLRREDRSQHHAWAFSADLALCTLLHDSVTVPYKTIEGRVETFYLNRHPEVGLRLQAVISESAFCLEHQVFPRSKTKVPVQYFRKLRQWTGAVCKYFPREKTFNLSRQTAYSCGCLEIDMEDKTCCWNRWKKPKTSPPRCAFRKYYVTLAYSSNASSRGIQLAFQN